jgi:hypothetical protein
VWLCGVSTPARSQYSETRPLSFSLEVGVTSTSRSALFLMKLWKVPSANSGVFLLADSNRYAAYHHRSWIPDLIGIAVPDYLINMFLLFYIRESGNTKYGAMKFPLLIC